MENGFERVEEAQLGSEKNTEEEVSVDKIMEKAIVGSDESKELEEDVFEEAIESQEQLQGQGAKSGLVEDLLAADGSGLIAVNESPELVTDVSADVGHETETFVEAVSVPAEAGNQEELAMVDGDVNVEDLVAGESIDKIDEGGTGKEEPGNQLGRGNEVSEIPHYRETEVWMNADEVKPHQGIEVLPEDSKSEIAGEKESGIEDVNSVELVNVADGLPEDKGKLFDANLSTMNTSHQDEKSKELEPKGDSPGVDFMSGADEAKLLTDVHSSVNIGHRDRNTQDLVDTSGTQHPTESSNPTALSTSFQTALEKVSVMPEALSSSSADKPVNGRNEEVLADSAYGRAEDDKGFEPQHAAGKVNDNGFESQHSTGKGDGAEQNNTVKKDPEKKEVNDLEEKQATDREHATHVSQQGAKLASSSGRSLSPDPEKKVGNDGEEKQATEREPATLASQQGAKLASSSGRSLGHDPEKKSENDREEKQVTDREHATHVSRQGAKLGSSPGRSSGPAPPPARPAGLGRAAPLLEPAPRAVQQPRVNGALSHMQSQQIEDLNNGESEEFDETREKLQMIRVKFLRLAHRLGQTPHNVVVAQVLYRLGLAEQLRGRNGGRVGAFSFDRASAMAEQLEAAGQEPLDFSCTIMVLGKTGVGKSATINSIFDAIKFNTDAFQLGTKKVQDVVGTVQGIKVRVIDTPGLLASWSDQRQNEKILHSVKRFIKKTPPDIVLYLDRLDVQSRDFGDMPLLRTITEIFGPSIWFNAIVVLTHAASAPPDGPNGTASSYDMFVTQRSHSVQHAIRQAAGDMRLMNPVSLVENHSACRTNRAGQRVLPNGQVWKPHLLLLSFASKILAEANTLLKLQDSPPGKPYAPRSRAPPLPFLLSSLLQSRSQVKLPDEPFGDEDGLDDDLDGSSDSEDDSGYDDLPPFKSLSKAQVEKLTKAQKKAYFDELEYREKLFLKKQLKEEKKRQKMMKKFAEAVKDLPSDDNVSADEIGGAASVPVPLPDLALPATFDSDNPTHRYRYLDTSSQWLVRPVLDSQGWDHDVGYEGINVEKLFVVKDKIPLSLSGQISKDKRDANVQMELASSLKHGKDKATLLGFDMQTVGKDLAYTFRSETRFSNFRKNKAAAGLSATLLGDALSAGVKVEDKLILHKRFLMVMSGGAMTSRGDVAYGGSLEAQLRDKDYPLGQSLSTLGLSVMDWHGDLAIGCNLQSQVPIGRSTNLIGRANWNNRGSGQISIRVNSSEQLQIALIGLIPLLQKLFVYPQHMQFGR